MVGMVGDSREGRDGWDRLQNDMVAKMLAVGRALVEFHISFGRIAQMRRSRLTFNFTSVSPDHVGRISPEPLQVQSS